MPPHAVAAALVGADDEIILRSPGQLLGPDTILTITGPAAPVSAGIPIEIAYAKGTGAR